MKRASLVVLSFLAISASAWSAGPVTDVSVEKDAQGVTLHGLATVTATIVGIDPATRTVTMKTSAGKVIELEVTNDVRNFDQLAVGDVVNAQYRESLTLSLLDKKTQASRSEKETAERAAPGAKPGGELGREVTIIADVVAVDRQAKVVTLRGPRGNMIDLRVQDPERLKRVKKGDQVKAVYTEALAISVEPATTK
jgi:Cu/Ag efflux protein CusF